MIVSIHPPAEKGIVLWNREEYHRLSALGFLQDYDKTELVAGEIVVSAKGRRHVLVTSRLRQTLSRIYAGQNCHILSQEPILVSNFDEPEPDVCVVRGQEGDYPDSHPDARDVLLVCEVSETTLARDLGPKLVAYGRAGIPEYWVINLVENRLEVYLDPSEDSGIPGYRTRRLLDEDTQLLPQSAPPNTPQGRVGEILMTDAT